jgi:hypothetical protein
MIRSRQQLQILNPDALGIATAMMDLFVSRVAFIHGVGETVRIP